MLPKHNHQLKDISDFYIDKTMLPTHSHSINEITDIEDKLSVMPGMITLWFGNPSLPPKGWSICNGNNGTPNMTNKSPVDNVYYIMKNA